MIFVSIKVRCIHCNSYPVLRIDSSGHKYMVICNGCGVHAGSHSSEMLASIFWEKVNDARECLGCNGFPRVCFNKQKNMWFMGCKTCGYKTDLNHSLQGALCRWHLDNKPNDAHYYHLWNEKYSKLLTQRSAI